MRCMYFSERERWLVGWSLVGGVGGWELGGRLSIEVGWTLERQMLLVDYVDRYDGVE